MINKKLIETKYITRVVIKRWGGRGQTARPYLWKQNPTDAEYRENWGDPRKLEQSPKVEANEPIIQKQKKGRGV